MRHRAREAGTGIGRSRAVHAALAAACCACAWTASACAQVSGSVGVVSDYRYRGQSLSDGDPAVQASVGYDAASGAYAGLFGSTTRQAGDAGSQWIPYAGFARRDRQGRSWDIGMRYVHFTREGPAYGDDYDYAEAHAGVAFQRVTVRLHYAPEYYGVTDNAYLEADFAWPVGERVRLLLHGGVSRAGTPRRTAPSYAQDGGGYGSGDGGGMPYGSLPHDTPRSDATPYDDPYRSAYGGSDRTRVDVSAGVVFQTGLCDVLATWHHVDGNGAGTAAAREPADRAGFVLGCIKRW